MRGPTLSQMLLWQYHVTQPVAPRCTSRCRGVASAGVNVVAYSSYANTANKKPPRPDQLKYHAVYKPFNVMCQFSAVEGKKTLADVIKVSRDVYPVGRLDYDSEGLLLLTNDARLNKRLLDPRYAHEREYLVQVEGVPSHEALAQLERGVELRIDGKPFYTRPCRAALLDREPELPPRDPPIRFRKMIPTSWLRLTLTEGKNRQVRRMTAAVGYPTLRLVRWSIEGITIDGMQPGDVSDLDKGTLFSKLKL